MTNIIQTVQSGAVDDVGSPSIAYKGMKNRWNLVNNLMGGTETMRAAREECLPINAAETTRSYERRLRGTFLYEGLNLAIETLLGKPFTEDARYSDEVDSGPLKSWLTNLDKCGSDLTTFCREVAFTGLSKGLVHILVDYSDTSNIAKPYTIAQKESLNLRPYAVVIDPERVLGWRYDLDGSVPVLSMVRIEEKVCVSLGKWGEEERRQIRVFERITDGTDSVVAFTVYQQSDPSATTPGWVTVQSGYSSCKSIPLVTIYFGRRYGFMQARPPLMGVVWLNLEHWISSSEQRNILNVARCPMWFFAGYDESVDSEGAPVERVVIGPDAMIKASDPNAKLSIVEHSGAAIGSGRQDLLDIEARMAHLTTELLTKKATSSSSATEKAHDNAGEDSKLGSMIKAEEDGMTTVLGFMYEYEGAVLPPGKAVTINTAFGLSPQDASDLQVLYNSRMEGLIDQITYLKELQRRGVLAPTVNVDDLKAAAAADGPVPPKPVAAALPPNPTTLTEKSGAGA